MALFLAKSFLKNQNPENNADFHVNKILTSLNHKHLRIQNEYYALKLVLIQGKCVRQYLFMSVKVE